MNQHTQQAFNNEKLQEQMDHFYLCGTNIKEEIAKTQQDIKTMENFLRENLLGEPIEVQKAFDVLLWDMENFRIKHCKFDVEKNEKVSAPIPLLETKFYVRRRITPILEEFFSECIKELLGQTGENQ